MGFLASIISLAADLFDWLRGRSDQKIGRQQQQNADLSKDNEVLQKELVDANNRPSDADTADKLRNGKF